MKPIRTLRTNPLLAPFATPMNFQGSENVRLRTSNDWN